MMFKWSRVKKNEKPDSSQILCVTPSRAEAMGLLGVFSEDGYDVTWVPGPEQALEQIEDKRFDLILADLSFSEARAERLVEAANRIEPAASWVLVNGIGRPRVLPFSTEPPHVDRPLKPDRVRAVVARALKKRSRARRRLPAPPHVDTTVYRMAWHLEGAVTTLTTDPAALWDDAGPLTSRLRRATDGFLRLAEILDRFVPIPREQPRPLDMRLAIEDAVFVLAEAWGNRIDIRTRLLALPPISARPSHIRHSILTLLLHAAQAIPGRGRLRIRAHTDNARAVITITDSGPGTSRAPADRNGFARALQALHAHGGEFSTFDHAGFGSTHVINLPLEQV